MSTRLGDYKMQTGEYAGWTLDDIAEDERGLLYLNRNVARFFCEEDTETVALFLQQTWVQITLTNILNR